MNDPMFRARGGTNVGSPSRKARCGNRTLHVFRRAARILQILCLGGWVASCASSQTASETATARRPNIVFIVTDDQGPWALGAAGNPDARTPNLDRLAAQGARLSNCFVTTPVCSPSRAALLTGLYPTEVDILDYLSGSDRGFALGLEARFPAWPRRLAAAGYATGLVGKWHLGKADEFHPTQFGYQEFAGFRSGAGTSLDPTVEVGGERTQMAGYTPDVLTDFAMDFVRRQAGKPFLLSLHFWAPHANTKNKTPDGDRTWLPLSEADWEGFANMDPVLPEPNYPKLDTPRAKRMMREYLASVASVDRNVGRLLTLLDQLGLEKDTIVIFTSDHGYNLGHHGIWHKGNGRWILTDQRGSHPNLYDTSLRVPALVRWPAVVPSGVVVDETVSQLDWFPTMLAAAGLGAQAGDALAAEPGPARGRNILPLLRGEGGDWNADFFAQYSMRHAIHADLRAYRTPSWKLVRDFLRDGVDQLYHLASDPGEKKNLIGSPDPVVQAKRRDLDTRLLEVLRRIEDPVAKAASSSAAN